MNYLSHFYIDRHIEDPYYTLGLVLPDLHRGFSKFYNQKFKNSDPQDIDNHIYQSIHKGILRHYEVDAFFHNSPFFHENVEILKRKIADRIPKFRRTYFAGHILLEMMLDRHILIEENKTADRFYEKLENTDEDTISMFFDHYSVKVANGFFEHLDNFLKWKYLYQYSDSVALTKAFSRVYTLATRIPLDENSQETLVNIIENMDEILKHKWRNPFNII